MSDGCDRAGAEPPWSAVVVTYEAGAHLAAAVESLLADHSAGAPPEVVVVDNGSTDGSTEALRRLHPDVAVVVPGANLGYARGANLGIACTTAPVVAVCNADVVVSPGAGAAMLARFAAEDDLGALGPSIRNPDGSPYPSARRDPGVGDALGHALLGALRPGNRFTRRYRNLDLAPDVPRDTDWCSGAAVWLRRAALDEVGGWDERYFLFFEDVDLGRRLRRAGWRVAYEPAAQVIHALGASRHRRPVRSVLAHHRGAYRYAAAWWRGPRRALLPVAAAALAGRGAVEAALALARPGRPGGRG